MSVSWKLASVTVLVLAVACSSGGDAPPPPPPLREPHTVVLSWDANREAAVTAPGGGYEVTIGSYPALDVPYVSSLVAPTTLTTTLLSGTYAVQVRAYGLGPDGTTTVRSAPTQMNLYVP